MTTFDLALIDHGERFAAVSAVLLGGAIRRVLLVVSPLLPRSRIAFRPDRKPLKWFSYQAEPR